MRSAGGGTPPILASLEKLSEIKLKIDYRVNKRYSAHSGHSEVDFAEGLEGAMFVVNNPNATASCGCGASFSI